jgi:dihydroorotate dehydrogenase electron transfer subunit
MKHDAGSLACAMQSVAPIVENRRIARDTFLMRLADPAMACAIRPGQFLMARPGLEYDPLLGRPFALYDVGRDGRGVPETIDFAYLILGRGTAALARLKPGDLVPIWGPLGNGFGPPPEGTGPIAFVAGGIGQTPFLALARWWAGAACYSGDPPLPATGRELVLYYGTRSADLMAGLDDFRSAGVELRLATNDGSVGHAGYITELLALDLERGWRPVKVVGCGPAPMLAALARLVERFDLDCDLSLENHMACGFGACFSCVAPIRQADGSIDLRRVCVEGPVFPARDVVLG